MGVLDVIKTSNQIVVYRTQECCGSPPQHSCYPVRLSTSSLFFCYLAEITRSTALIFIHAEVCRILTAAVGDRVYNLRTVTSLM